MTVSTPCDNCGEIVEKYPANIERYDNHFCSNDCKESFETGSNHNQWDGGDSHEYRGDNWHRKRREVLERDEYTCQFCGKQECDADQLNVHHIVPFRRFDVAEEANNDFNLVVLCNECHHRVETRYSPGEQLDLFFR